MSKHTRGPWTADLSFERPHISAKGGEKLIAVTGSSQHPLPDDENKANALLIAAAPDLLAALREARDVLEVTEYFDPDADRIEGDTELDGVRARVDAAIAKAEGWQP